MHVIDMIDAHLLKVAAPNTPLQVLAVHADPAKLAAVEFGVDTVREIACFIAQGAHESAGFTRLDENLNYSADRLAAVWPGRFAVPGSRPPRPNGLALSLHRQPEAIANRVYAGRMGNGGPASGDGWRFRGGGIPQLTGRRNYEACAADLGMSVEDLAREIRLPRIGWRAWGWFFEENDIGRLAATPGVEDETRAINGGQHGLADRRDRFDDVVRELLRRGA